MTITEQYTSHNQGSLTKIRQIQLIQIQVTREDSDYLLRSPGVELCIFDIER